MALTPPPPSVDDLNAALPGTLPGLLGIRVTGCSRGEIRAELPVRADLLAPNGYLHAATVVALADTACGLGARGVLPPDATGFTTVELTSNFLGTARDGTVVVTATAAHVGGTTQVWDATVTHLETGRTTALFRCTQLVLRRG